MPVKRFYLLDETEAALARTFSSTGNALDPVLIRGGPYLGAYILPLAINFDPAYANYRLAFALFSQANIDTEEAFPPVESD